MHSEAVAFTLFQAAALCRRSRCIPSQEIHSESALFFFFFLQPASEQLLLMLVIC